MTPKDLSKTQAAILVELRRRADRAESPPTYRELCAQFGWSSTGTARDHLRALARKGHIKLADGRARQVQLLEPVIPVVRVPLLGRVVAGAPVPADQDSEGMVPVPGAWIRSGVHFAVRVTGDSMLNAGILPDDLVVVRSTPLPNDGDIVVATVDGETTLKRYRRNHGRLRLVPENPSYHPIDLRERDSVIIHGVVVGLLRDFGDSRSWSDHSSVRPRRTRRASLP